MEWTAKKLVTDKTVELIRQESVDLNSIILEEGKNGTKPIGTFPFFMKGTLPLLYSLYTGHFQQPQI